MTGGVLTACGGGGVGGGTSGLGTSTYTYGGPVIGTSGRLGLHNVTTPVSVSSNGTVAIASGVSAGTAYSVTVATQPVLQDCKVTNGSGTATANVSNVTVICSNSTPILIVTPQSVKNLHL